MAEDNSGTLAPVDNSPTLTSVVGEMFGDFRDAEPESDAGAPLDATPDESADSPADGSEGPAASEPAGDPPAAADAPADPDTDSPAPAADSDPLDGATPLDYTVAGQTRSFDGITVLKDGGAIIDPDALHKVQRVFGERDHLFEQSQASHRKYSDLERLTTWHTKDASGNARTLTGRDGLEAQRTLLARSIATSNELSKALEDPGTIASLIAGVDELGNVVLNPQAIEYIRTRIENAAMKAESVAKGHFSTMAVAPPEPETPVSDHAMPTVDATIAHLKVTGLTAEDKQFLAAQLPRYVRPTTPEEKQQGMGTRIVDAEFTALVQREAKRAANVASIATTAASAARTNNAKLAAASRGKQSTNAPRITPPKEPERTRADDFEDFWDKQEKAAAGALRAHASGR